ncbi:hypothetical protein L1987_19564 [Smallanthus sonchifolius]|uniref:Uncharacterized protein n=1 Tax=Smallanthus sonchifolius TaxID=185202 RepID=A0ACB9IPU6_9ASTR|nr:hypothetical protein L1987_19564 [Smallanthus sonchifolius]
MNTTRTHRQLAKIESIPNSFYCELIMIPIHNPNPFIIRITDKKKRTIKTEENEIVTIPNLHQWTYAKAKNTHSHAHALLLRTQLATPFTRSLARRRRKQGQKRSAKISAFIPISPLRRLR